MHGFFTSYFYSFFLDCFQKMAKIISVDWRRSQNNKPEGGHHANCIWGRDKSALNLICPSEKGKFLCLSIAVVVGANFSECWQLGGAEQGSGPATVLTSTQEEPRTLAVESSAPKSWWGRWGRHIYVSNFLCMCLSTLCLCIGQPRSAATIVHDNNGKFAAMRRSSSREHSTTLL